MIQEYGLLDYFPDEDEPQPLDFFYDIGQQLLDLEHRKSIRDFELLKQREESGTLSEAQQLALSFLRRDVSMTSYKNSLARKQWTYALRYIKVLHKHVLRILNYS